jgi:hypothetical protein
MMSLRLRFRQRGDLKVPGAIRLKLDVLGILQTIIIWFTDDLKRNIVIMNWHG